MPVESLMALTLEAAGRQDSKSDFFFSPAGDILAWLALELIVKNTALENYFEM
jgi:hypothetical protein